MKRIDIAKGVFDVPTISEQPESDFVRSSMVNIVDVSQFCLLLSLTILPKFLLPAQGWFC
jgi:hypothetical protein